jgi:predicted GIY-YIG superfamily endonuclease
MLFFVYKLTRNDDLEYIGITNDISRRLSQHKKSKRFNIGIKNISVLKIVENYEQAEELEEFFIEQYDTWKNGLNLTKSGKGLNEDCKFNTFGYKFSNESREKMKKNHWSKTGKYNPKGKKVSEKMIDHLRKIAKERSIRTKLNEQDIRSILLLYKSKPFIENVNLIGANGKKINYETLFAKKYYLEFNITSAHVKNIILNKTKAWSWIYQEIINS